MNLAVKIQLPTEFSDERADKFRIYKLLDTGSFSLLSEIAIGTEFYVDINTMYGISYYFTAYDSTSGNESTASPIARIFKRRSTTPFVV